MLIDPPFEEAGEFARLALAFEKAHRRWPGGNVIGWYPLKHENQVGDFINVLRNGGIEKLLRVEFWLAPAKSQADFRGCGVIVKNPPFVLTKELNAILPFLCRTLGTGKTGFRIEWLAREAKHG